MSRLKKGLALILTLCMMLSLMPVITPSSQAANGDDFYKIVHVDAGRKYFSPENLKKIIDNAAAAGFNQVELYLSDNQGFRFALNDMTVTTSTGKTYDLTPALGDGYTDDGKTPDGSGKYLTQSEMTDIISYATGKGIDIVPCINVPGHMGAILEEFSSFRYSGSKSSIDLENKEAVAFALAITEKYATYFESQGVKYYNLGADEYANDLSTMGFQGLYTSGKYQKFVDFLNSAAQIVIDHSMTPRAFNDGIYYNEDNTYSINSAIEVCYWSCGWSDYNLASAQYLVNQGMKVINTHGGYYWVLGNSSWQCSAQKARQFDYTSFQYRTGTTGNGTISDPEGAMFCIWCDVGNADGTDDGAAVVSATADVIAAFGAALPSSSTEPTKEPIPDAPVAMTVGGSATLTLSESANWETSDENVISLTSTARALTGTSVTATAVGAGTATITATTDAKVYTADITVAAAETDEVINGGEYELTVNSSTAVELSGHVGNEGTYTTEDGVVKYTIKHATETTEGSTETTRVSNLETGVYIIGNGSRWLTLSGEQLGSTTNPAEATKWTITKNDDKYTISSGSYYLGWTQSSNKGMLYTNYSYALQFSQQNEFAWSYNNSGFYSNLLTSKGNISGNKSYSDVYLRYSGGWQMSTYNSAVGAAYIVETTDSTQKSTTVTFTGVAVGTTYVTVGNTRYTITVKPKPVTPLTVEFWITNQQVTANGTTSMTIAATVSGVYSESGVDITTLVPATGTQNNNPMVFWKGTRLASNNKQTTGGGVDKTKSGTDFTYVRYWEGSWAYSADGETWTNVVSGDQIVAYYLQKTEVTDEITTLVSDYGNVPGYGTSLSPFVMVDYAVKYESGELTPSSFPTAKTIAFHCNYESSADLGNTVIQDGTTYYRKLGTIKAVETADYEVYMITLRPTSDTKTDAVATNAKYATNYRYNGTEKVVWVDDEANLGDFADESLHYTSPSGNIKYTVGGEPNISGLEIYKNQCMLVTYYVRAKVTEDSLAVHYIDQTANQEFYSYNIAVKSGTLFNENIGLADPWKGNLTNGSVTNLQDKTQTVSADLSTMPAIGAQYRYSEYTCVEVVRSEDGKDVYLYYTFSNTHNFVIDFGLPLKITKEDLNIDGDWTSATVTNATYGTVAKNDSDQAITYTPNRVLLGVDSFNLTLAGSNGSVTHTIYIYPATTVYYEEGFATYNGNWGSSISKGSGFQTASPAGSKHNYGYDTKYADEVAGSSNGTQATSSAPDGTKNYATFTFTGTGVDVYANCTTQEAKLMIGVYQGTQTNSPLQVISVNTKMENGSGSATAGQGVDAYNVPVASVTGLDYGEYTLKIIHVKVNNSTTGGAVNLDGFRVYGTLATEPEFYKDDLEDNPTFIELRDEVLTAQNVSTADSKYADQIAKDVYSQVFSSSDKTQGAVILSNNDNLNSDALKDLLDNGPKNEIYLRNGQSLVFTVTTDRMAQIGLKALDKATYCTVKVDGTALGNIPSSFTSSTDMFYTLFGPSTSETQRTVTITNNGDGILSITKLKICDDPNAALGTLTADDLIPALVSLGFKAPEGEEGSSGTETPTTPPTTDPGAETPTTPADPATGLPFTDVGPGDWFLENVKYVYEKGLMNGTSDTTFSPKKTTNRAMIVTILHRLEGTPAPGAPAPFTDVPADQYYAEAVAWAAANSIVNGTSETTYAPLNNITREQMAAILYRYAQYKNYDVSGSADLSAFTDAASISDYAVSALQWAVDAGLINGKGNGILDPKGSATRAEVSAILSRFCENIAG